MGSGLNKVTLLHNPRCSKSRAALALLKERGIAPDVVDYLREPLAIVEIERLPGLLDMQPRELIRVDEREYRSNGLENTSLSRGELVAALHAYPGLMQRPIVIANGKAVVGRPPEAVLEIL